MNRATIAAVFASLACFSAAPAMRAHPSVGIVIGPAGDVFYSDLTQVWRITPAGEKSVVVPNVHTHELSVDSSGSVFGEDSKWLGGDHYRHRIWRRAANGRISDVVPWRDGFWREYGFARDAAGAMYWVKCTPARVCSILKRAPGGPARTVVQEGQFSRPINWIAASPAGDVYVVHGPDLRRVNRHGRIETVARISARSDAQLMGVTVDSAGNVYVAAHADRTIVRVAPSGQVRVVARSAAPWAPSGVAVSPGGDLWILEWAGTRTRVRRLSARQ